jgi:uncharacterized membrane protein
MRSAPNARREESAAAADQRGAMAWLRRVVVGGSAAWAAALPLATFAAAEPHPAPVVYLAAFVVYAIGGAVCHQLEPRSFHLWGRQMPVCARCTGIYLGAAVAAVLTTLADRGRPSTAGRLVVAAATLPMAASLAYEWTTGDVPSNVTRAATGIVLGAAVGWLIASGTSRTRDRGTDTM